MTLSDEATERLADIVELQPTKNSELEDELKEYYYRDDNSLIRATEDAADLVDVEPGISGDAESGVDSIRVPRLQAQIFQVLAGPDERSESVVSVLHKLRDEFDVDPDADAVREGLQSLRRKSVVEVEYRTVPTFRLTVDRDSVDVSVTDE